jgi:2',3'-cyclic-nucleotide 2'-phosphodiesterase (5'-nucleotidase family)
MGSVIREYLVKTFESPKGNLKIGFLGILGPDGCLVSRATREDVRFIGFSDDKSKLQLKELADHLQKKIDYLRTQAKVDLVILTMHGGGEESHDLANALSGLDVLIAGHTHKLEFEIVNGTIVTQTGSYGENLGYLNLVYDTVKRKLALFDGTRAKHIAIDASMPASSEWSRRVSDWRKKSLSLMGLSPADADEIVFVPDKDYLAERKLFSPMGLFVTTAVHKELNSAQAAKIDLYFTSAGLIRKSFFKGIPYTQSDLFNIFSIGFDDNQKPGVDIVAFYLTPKEIRTLLNFLELYSKFSGTFSPVMSDSIGYDIRWWGIPFLNRVTNLKLHGVDLDKHSGLIKVATNSFVAKSIDTIHKISYGLVSVVPKDENGNPTSRYQIYPKEYEMLIGHLKRLKLDAKN